MNTTTRVEEESGLCFLISQLPILAIHVSNKETKVIGTLFALILAILRCFPRFVVIVPTKLLTRSSEGDKQQNAKKR